MRARVEAVGSTLRAALQEVVHSICGPSPRPGDLIAATGLDKSLAGRLLRALRSDSPLEALHHFPATQGLRMLVDSAEASGATELAIDRGRCAIDDYDALLLEFSGRPGLDAALSGWLPEALEAGQRRARQAVYRSMSYLVGYSTLATQHTVVLSPSRSDDGRVDVTTLVGHIGLQRLRAGSPVILSGQSYKGKKTETLAGDPPTGEGREFLLRHFCTDPLPALEVMRGESNLHLTLPRNAPPVNEPITLVSAVITREAYARYREEGERFIPSSVAPRIPSRSYTGDLFIHRDLYAGRMPIVRIGMRSLGVPWELYSKDPDAGLDEMDFTYDEIVKETAKDIGHPEVPRYTELMAEAFASLGFPADEFRLQRVRWQYPIPSAAILRWIEPEDPPGV